MVYFCDAPIPQDALADDQYQRLREIMRSFRERGLLASYSSVDDLRRVLPLHVNGTINSLLIQQRASGQPIPSQGTATAPMPDIRVTVASGLLKQGSAVTASLIVEVQNHSPADFFFSSLMFQLADGSQLFVPRNFATGEYLAPQKIESGNNFTFVVEPTELAEASSGRGELTVVVAKDKIDRRFQSRPGELSRALSDALDPVEMLRKHSR